MRPDQNAMDKKNMGQTRTQSLLENVGTKHS